MAIAATMGLAMMPAGAATSGTVVGATVLTATNIAPGSCPASAPATDLGSVLPGSSTVTSSDCTVTFGSSNGTARLNVRQTDAAGAGMWRTSRGALDTTFSGDGLLTEATAPGANNDGLTSMVRQSTGRIVGAGGCMLPTAETANFCLAGWDASGVLDPSFGTGGLVSTHIQAGTSWDYPADLIEQPDGKLFAVGECNFGAGGNNDVCMARYSANGALDPTFAGDGTTGFQIASGTDSDAGMSAANAPGGSLVIAGQCQMPGNGWDICVARIRSDGTLDPTFSGDGKLTLAVGAGTANDAAKAVHVHADGRILVVGTCDLVATGSDFCLVTLTPAGALDTGFGTGGIVTTPIGSGANADGAEAATVLSDGRIVVGGGCNMGATSVDMCAARYNSDGSLDTTFSSDGLASFPRTWNDQTRAVLIEPDGSVILAGGCDVGSWGWYDFCMVKLSSSGTPDTSFGSSGIVLQGIATAPAADTAYAIVARPDGGIVIGGSCEMGGATGNDFCLAAFTGGGTVSPYGAGNDWATPGAGFFGACLRAVAGGSTATWTANATCASSDGAWWNAVPTSNVQVALAPANTTTAIAHFRFALRTTTAQPPGRYLAPITFEVTAP